MPRAFNRLSSENHDKSSFKYFKLVLLESIIFHWLNQGLISSFCYLVYHYVLAAFTLLSYRYFLQSESRLRAVSLFHENPWGGTLIVSVTYEQRMPRAHTSHAHCHATTLTCLAFFPIVFEEMRDCSKACTSHDN